MASANPTHYALMIAELRRSYAHLNSYKSDIVVISGLDAGDRVALDERFRHTDAPPRQYDKEDRRFILKGPHFAPMEILNCLAQQRGYKMIYPPQQHGIPMKTGAMDDKFALIYQLSKDAVKKPKPRIPDSGLNSDIEKKPKAGVAISDKTKVKSAKKKSLYSDTIYSGKGWEKLMHGQKIDSSHHDRRRPEHEDTDNTDELDTEEDDEEKCLDMNEYYDNEDEVADCGDCGGGDE